MKKLLPISIFLNLICIPLTGIYLYRKVQYYQRLKIEAHVVVKATPQFPAYYYKINPNWLQQKTMFEVMPHRENAIVFLGNSITAFCAWSELFNNINILNRGIPGDNTEGVLERIYQVTRLKPRKIFIMIGTNDLSFKYPVKKIIKNYKAIVDSIQLNSPKSIIYLYSVLPKGKNLPEAKIVPVLNDSISALAVSKKCQYINLFPLFSDKDGYMRKDLSNDGIHLYGSGYLIWKKAVEQFVN